MASNRYNWTTVPGGFTGPSGKIGMQSPDGAYHIDTKISSSMSPEDVVNAFTAAALKFKKVGRRLVFSNEGVSGKEFDPFAPFDQRLQLIKSAAQAHAAGGRNHPGWYSLDYYAVLPNKSGEFDRFRTGAVEDATIFVPAPVGSKVQHASGGGYGFYTTVLDPKTGQPIIKTGHGNIDRPIKDKNNYIVTDSLTPGSNNSTTPPGTANPPAADAAQLAALNVNIFVDRETGKVTYGNPDEEPNNKLFGIDFGNVSDPLKEAQKFVSDFARNILRRPDPYGSDTTG